MEKIAKSTFISNAWSGCIVNLYHFKCGGRGGRLVVLWTITKVLVLKSSKTLGRIGLTKGAERMLESKGLPSSYSGR